MSDLDSKKGKLNQLFSELMHDNKANKPIGAVCANVFAYAALTLFYIANLLPLRERLYTHKVLTKDQCFYLNYHKLSIKSYVLDVY